MASVEEVTVRLIRGAVRNFLFDSPGGRMMEIGDTGHVTVSFGLMADGISPEFGALVEAELRDERWLWTMRRGFSGELPPSTDRCPVLWAEWTTVQTPLPVSLVRLLTLVGYRYEVRADWWRWASARSDELYRQYCATMDADLAELKSLNGVELSGGCHD